MVEVRRAAEYAPRWPLLCGLSSWLRPCCGLLCALAVGVLSPAWGQTLFGPAVPVPAGHGARALASGDIDGDGWTDLLVAGEAGVWSLGNDGRGGFIAPQLIAPVEGSTAIARADFNADGQLDIAVADEGRQMAVLLHGGDRTTWAFKAPVEQLLVADLNGDERADLAYLQPGGLGFIHGGSVMDKRAFLALAFPQAAAVADFDLDGAPDVAVHQWAARDDQSRAVSLLFNWAGGEAWTTVEYPARRQQRVLTAADFDDDGTPELVGAGEHLEVWPGLAGGTLGSSFLRGGQGNSVSLYTGVCSADLDGDGLLDLAAGLTRKRLVSVWRGHSERVLDAQGHYPLHGDPTAVVCGDWDRDGDVDLALPLPRLGQLAVMYNLSLTPSGPPPVAHAGPRRRVFAGDWVQLDGRGSLDPDLDSLRFAWRQIAGSPVELVDADLPRPSFAAPLRADTLRFALTVDDGRWTSRADSVELPVLPLDYGAPAPARQGRWTGLLTTSAPIEALAVDPADPGTVYAGTAGQGIFKTTDSGRTWTPINSGLEVDDRYGDPLSGLIIHALAIAPTAAGTVYSGTEGGLFINDGGQSWRRLAGEWGLLAWRIRALQLVGDRLYAGAGECTGLIYTDDEGRSAENAHRGLPLSDVGVCFGGVRYLGGDPFDPTIRYAVVSNSWNLEFLRLVDETGWQRTGIPQFNSAIRTLAVGPRTGWLYIGLNAADEGGAVVYRSRRLGVGWEAMGAALPADLSVRALVADPQEALTLYMGTDRGLYRSLDGGAVWEHLGGPEDIRALALASAEPRPLYVGTGAGTLHRLDLQRTDQATMVDAAGWAPGRQVSLQQNRPNPFNARTQIAFRLAQSARAQLVLYNALGQPVRRLVDEHREAGIHRVWWDGRDEEGRSLGSGIYFYRLEVDGRVQIRASSLLK